MALLLGASAFFSGSETAFFNLSRRQIELFKKSRNKFENLTARLMSKPAMLLSCFLFGNMTVNILFYALASVLLVGIEKQFGVTAAALAAVVTFAMLVLFGEIIPKSLAYINSQYISVAAAMPAYLFTKVFSPVVMVFRFLTVEPALRLILGPRKHPKPISADEFKTLIGQGQRRGLISEDENKLVTEIIELGFLKVRHVMRPRVDIIACDVTASNRTICLVMQQNHFTKIPIYVKKIDNIVGQVYLRSLLLNRDTSPDKLVQRIHFVPEQKTVESLLEFFRKSHTDTAIVVDEYGGIAGLVTLEDIAEELLGPIEPTEGIEPMQQIGPMEYRLAGNLAIHDWAGTFGIDATETKLATIAGLVTAMLGKIPKPGDTASLRNLKFTVEKVKKHRIESIILTFEPSPETDERNNDK